MLDRTKELIKEVGSNIKTARLRRGLTIEVVAKRSGHSESTVKRLEAGQSGVGLDIVADVLMALNLEDSLLEVASPRSDRVGLDLERLKGRKRGRRKGSDDELETDF